ncbi:hypothetical protein GYMLUDRAFT_72499 [Collybiopsis luxurians FD-317 M1]|uniref:ABM domain-containing protein n=1 Tax=Collybiopsis luxurians FD-317 M1 TaxID=944289 RepID=A0A0D0C3N0_9AGAR|nr:hypothetical protein GYMLUDRAFT_72499 [Collybiopsis luxurians FD-317 M1]
MSTGNRIIECNYFDASDAMLNNRGQFADALAQVHTVDGHLSAYWGVQVPEEGGKKGYVISVWESYEHYQKFASTDLFNKGLETLKIASAGDLKRASFKGAVGSPLPAMQAVITETVLVRPKAGVSGDQIKAAAQKLGDAFSSNGHHAALGESVDKDGLYLIMVGWASVAESRSTVKSEPYASAIAAFASLADLEVTHAILDQHN